MREIIIITVSIVFVIIMYPIVFPDRSVILYVRDLSEKNAGQKYRYQILFKLRSCKDVELICILTSCINVCRQFSLQGT